ncbi:hypothetical protein KSP39_PZI023449 [Platanthera zijinensis]|uniref:Uncharacterized protein n=1 Tax=Platanthera zijinensis TaxID=2320716 RepID=A0AAP0ASM2_9ASPA
MQTKQLGRLPGCPICRWWCRNSRRCRLCNSSILRIVALKTMTVSYFMSSSGCDRDRSPIHFGRTPSAQNGITVLLAHQCFQIMLISILDHNQLNTLQFTGTESAISASSDVDGSESEGDIHQLIDEYGDLLQALKKSKNLAKTQC